MNKYIKYTAALILMIGGCFSLLSCTSENENSEVLPAEYASLSLNFSPLAQTDDDSDIEWVKTLRVVILDADGRVKENYLSSFNYEDLQDFIHTINFYSKAGTYRIYAIANEESIESFDFQDYDFDVQDKTITQILDSYINGDSGFEDMVNSLYFTPDYSKPVPMSCYYQLELNEGGNEYELHLVNVATKFMINFSNYRVEQVIFNSVKIKNAADSNFLMAHIDEDSRYLNGKYWIEWLKDVVDDTNNNSQLDNTPESNDNINAKWGWLRDYSLPSSASHKAKEFLAPGETWSLAPATTQTGDLPLPNLDSKGPFYLPESKYIPSGKTSPSYTIEFEIQRSGNEAKVISKELRNIKTLFRHTYAIIDVDIVTGVEEIYVEVYPWVPKDVVHGTISPE